MNKFNSIAKKLNFSDVYIVPRTSTIKSRKDVSLKAEYNFRNSNRTWNGVPIICSNMDSISTPEMYNELSKHGIISCFNKHLDHSDYDVMHLEKYTSMFSMGINDKDFKNIDYLINKYNPHFICMDVANGYTDELLFAIDLTKRKYNLVLSKIYCKSPYTKGSKQLVDNIQKVFSEGENQFSSFTRLKYIELYFTKEKAVVEEPKKGFIGNFLDRFKDKEIPVEEKIIDDDYQSCKRYIDRLDDGDWKFFVSNKETLDEIIKVYGVRLVQKDLKESDGGFIATLKKLPEPSNSRSNLRW